MSRVRCRLRAGEPSVDAEPFKQWLDQQCDAAPLDEVADMIGFGYSPTGVRRMFRYRYGRIETARNGQPVIAAATVYPRSVVEDALHRVRPGLFYDLYPEYLHELDDVTLEPDAWCPFCQQLVTPIDGLCPFCLCEHGHLFREVGVTEDGFACVACLAEERRERMNRVSREYKAKMREAA